MNDDVLPPAGREAQPESRFDGLPALDGVAHRRVDLPGLRMHVAEAGRGTPVLLLHGFPQHWWEWREVVPVLAEHHRVIAPDLRGSGWTDAPARGYTGRQLDADLIALLDTLRIDRVWLIGHDFGALLGYRLCLRHPERVAGYLALGPHPFIRFDPRLLAGMAALGFQLVIVTPGLGPRRLASPAFARSLLLDHAAADHAWNERDIELFIARLRDPRRARAAAALYRGFILREEVAIMSGGYRRRRLETPTRVLYGAQEGMDPTLLAGFEDCAVDMTLEVVPNAAHFIVDEQPGIVVDRALEFFGGTRWSGG